MGKINNAKIGTFEYMYFDETGLRKKIWNAKYSDEFIINCLKEYYFSNLTSMKIEEKYNLPNGTVRDWSSRFKYGKSYRFYCEGGICDKLKGIINLKDYICLDLDRPNKGKYTGKYNQIKNMYLQGYEYKEITKKLAVHDSTIAHVIKRFNLPRRRPEYHTLDFMW